MCQPLHYLGSHMPLKDKGKPNNGHSLQQALGQGFVCNEGCRNGGLRAPMQGAQPRA